jgi:hypothetical protein
MPPLKTFGKKCIVNLLKIGERQSPSKHSRAHLNSVYAVAWLFDCQLFYFLANLSFASILVGFRKLPTNTKNLIFGDNLHEKRTF